jgi:2-phospho-L-lactate/phosphoenolpyruvate guanylyltransferase
MMWAVVPLKSPDQAKSRLAEVLDPAQRRELFFALARQVIEALRATPGVDAVGAVTSSIEVANFARALGAQPIFQAGDFGTRSAYAAAVEQLQPLRLDGLLMIAGDLPLVSPAALARLAGAAGPAPAVVVVPDRRRIGTNALLCTPPGAIAPCFGGGSFSLHLAAAAAAGIEARVLELDELALDLDVAEDLEYLHSRGGALAAQLLPAGRSVAEGRLAEPRRAGMRR